MPHMHEVVRLTLGLLSSTCGMAWLAFAMKSHWQQVKGEAVFSAATVMTLRALGSVAIALSLWLYVGVDHVSMAALVWVMSLAASALIVAFTLSWRPRLLAWLLLWTRA